MCCYRLRPCLCADLCDNKFGKDFEQVVANLCGQPCSLLPIYHGRYGDYCKAFDCRNVMCVVRSYWTSDSLLKVDLLIIFGSAV